MLKVALEGGIYHSLKFIIIVKITICVKIADGWDAAFVITIVNRHLLEDCLKHTLTFAMNRNVNKRIYPMKVFCEIHPLAQKLLGI